MFDLTNTVIARFWIKFINYLPDFFAGLIILIIGLILSVIIKKIIVTLFQFIRLEHIVQKTKLANKQEVAIWGSVLAELLRWTIIILFLIPTLEAWGLSRATAVLNQLLFYIPNVVVAVIIAFVGLIAANLVADLVRNSMKTIGSTSANTLSVFSKSTIIFFTVLIIMNQLGVAQDLIRILFTGIVAMIAIAGGLAFGLGGQGMAKDLLDELKRKLR
jgi:hypothetical protein